MTQSTDPIVERLKSDLCFVLNDSEFESQIVPVPGEWLLELYSEIVDYGPQFEHVRNFIHYVNNPPGHLDQKEIHRAAKKLYTGGAVNPALQDKAAAAVRITHDKVLNEIYRKRYIPASQFLRDVKKTQVRNSTTLLYNLDALNMFSIAVDCLQIRHLIRETHDTPISMVAYRKLTAICLMFGIPLHPDDEYGFTKYQSPTVSKYLDYVKH